MSDSGSNYSDNNLRFNQFDYFDTILANFELDDSMVELFRVIELHPEVDANVFIDYGKKIHPDLYFWLDSNDDLVISIIPKKVPLSA